MRPGSLIAGVFALGAALTAALDARADTLSVTAVADAFVSSADPAGNFGGAGALSVAADGLPNGEFQSVIRFDAGAIRAGFDAQFGPGQWTLQSAELQLNATAPNNPAFNPSAPGALSVEWMQNDSWIEGTGGPSAPSPIGITFANLPSFQSAADEALGTFAYDGATSGADFYPLSLGAGLAADALAGDLISLRLFAADETIAYVFNSRNFGTVTSRPTLSFTAVPEPATCSLMLLAAAAIACSRRSR